MSSQNKKKKLKNSYCCGGALKEKDFRLKRILFFTSALRKKLKNQARKDIELE
jgi:hypothetical protein